MIPNDSYAYPLAHVADPLGVDLAIAGLRVLIHAGMGGEVYSIPGPKHAEAYHQLVGVRQTNVARKQPHGHWYVAMTRALRSQLRRLEARRASWSRRPPYLSKLSRLSQALVLTPVEDRVFRLAWLSSQDERLERLLKFHATDREPVALENLSELLQCTEEEVEGALGLHECAQMQGVLIPPPADITFALPMVHQEVARLIGDNSVPAHRLLALLSDAGLPVVAQTPPAANRCNDE